MLVVWGLPYGLASFYDLLKGQGYVSDRFPLLSEFIPKGLPSVWLVVGIIAFIIVTFEGAYRIAQKERNGLRTAERKNFSLNWENYEWQLRRQGWESPIWEDDSEGYSLLLKGWVWVNTIDTAHIESMALYLGGQTYNCVWESRNYYGSEECPVDCDVPLNMNRDKKTAYLVAIVNGETYKSKTFTLNLPQVKQAAYKEGSQT